MGRPGLVARRHRLHRRGVQESRQAHLRPRRQVPRPRKDWIAIAVPAYNNAITRSKEAVLKQNLFTLRSLLSQYTLDKQKAPQSLEDLVAAGYLKQIPNDPITSQPNWQVEQEEATIMSPDEQDEGGVVDVHSTSDQVGSNGKPYNTW